MTDTTETTQDEATATTRDWIRAWVAIAIVVALVILIFYIGIGGFCGCGTRPSQGG